MQRIFLIIVLHFQLSAFLFQLKAQVEPLISTAWYQTAPYNQYCPEGTLAGCVAIAMSQVMNYHQYPEHGTGKNTYRWNNKWLTADFENTYYRWEEMSTNPEAAAELIYHCGVSVWMDYDSGFSGSSEYYAKSALTDFFAYDESIQLMPRNKYSDQEWADILKAQLDLHHPIIYSSGGHTFIVDGYNSDGLFHANMGYSYTGSNRYYSLEGLGSKNNSTALINIFPMGRPVPTAVESLPQTTPSVRKYILNGRLIIEREGVRYSVNGEIIR